MSNAVTLDGNQISLPAGYAQTILTEGFEGSVVGKLSGATPISLGTTSVPVFDSNIELGVTGELEDANTQGAGLTFKHITPQKATAIVVVSKELAKANPANVMQHIEADLKNAVGKALDTMVIHGKDAQSGADFSAAGLAGIVSTSNVIDATEEGFDWKTGILSAYDLAGTKRDPNGVAVDTRYKTATSLIAQDVQYGLPNLASVQSTLAGLPAAYGRTVGRHNDVRAIVGDWTAVKYGFADSIEIERSTEATIVDGDRTINLFQAGGLALRVTVNIGFSVLDPDAFAVIKDVTP